MSASIPTRERLVVAIAALASTVAFLDGTIVTVALPAIERELGGGLTLQQWTVDAYLLTLGALILVAGSVSDAFGRVLVLRIGLIGFGVASLAVGLAPDPLVLVIARGLQGAAGAFLVPSSLALITSQIAHDRQARAIGLWTALTTSAMLAGPVLGGLFVDFLSWRWAFLINVLPIAITLWLLARFDGAEHRDPDAGVDVFSAVLCAAGLGGIVFALVEQPTLGWGHPGVWVTGLAGAALTVVFVLRQRTTRHPLLPLSLLRIRTFSAGNLATLFIYAALTLNGFVVGVYLQQGAGLSATLAGLAGLPTTVLLIALSPSMGALSSRWGARLFMTVGPLVMAGGALLLLLVGERFDYWWQVLPGMLVLGIGLGITVSPLTAAILGSVPSDRSGIASAINNAVARIAGLLSVALLGTIAGGALDLDGFHRAAIATAAMLVAGGVISFLGVRETPAHAHVLRD